MTVEYNYLIATSKGLGNFGKLLCRWKGSIYKLVYPDMLLYCVAYGIIFGLYRFYFSKDPHQKRVFEAIITYCKDRTSDIPISFVLGFYISQVVSRWWTQFMTCPWPDTLSVLIASHLQGGGERSRLMRRTFMRYINLAFTLTMIMMSPQAKARFPTLEHLVEAGFLMPHEKLIIEHLNEKSNYSKYWIPLIWSGAIAQRARREGRIADDMALSAIVKAIAKFRGGLGDLLGFDWVNIPLVYTQVVTLVVYVYFITGLFGKQIPKTENVDTDTYIPVILFAEFFFYMGWLKVGETMVCGVQLVIAVSDKKFICDYIGWWSGDRYHRTSKPLMLNPWGEDDDDFAVNWLIDRNFTVAYLIVDEMHAEHPEMLKDTYWDEVVPEDLPYTEAAMKYKKHHGGSAENEDHESKTEFIVTDKDTIGTRGPVRVNSVVRARGSIIGKAEPSRKGSYVSNHEYKQYMDNTFCPLENDER